MTGLSEMSERRQAIKRASQIRWIGGFKYRTTESYYVFTNLRPRKEICLNRITLRRDGMLFVTAGYSSDGPSGPTIDTPDIMPGATVMHDPGYELLRNEMMGAVIDIVQPNYRPGEGLIYNTPSEDRIINNATHEQIRHELDKMLADMMLEDGAIVRAKLKQSRWLSFLFEKIECLDSIVAKAQILRAQYFYDGLRIGGVSSAIVPRKEYVAP